VDSPIKKPCFGKVTDSDTQNSLNWTKESWTPLHYAACHGTFDMVKLLLRLGATINIDSYDSERPLNLAVIRREGSNVDVVRALLEGGADINHMDKLHHRTALHEAASTGNQRGAALLLDRGAEVNAQWRGKKKFKSWRYPFTFGNLLWRRRYGETLD
jgi:ankyrin repeat protein